MIPNVDIKIGELIEKVDIGSHTTSNAKLYHVKGNGKIIDSPGIREFGLWHYDSNKIHEGFTEIYDASSNCKFRDCLHQHNSKGCAVIAAATSTNGLIHPVRLENFRKLLENSM